MYLFICIGMTLKKVIFYFVISEMGFLLKLFIKIDLMKETRTGTVYFLYFFLLSEERFSLNKSIFFEIESNF